MYCLYCGKPLAEGVSFCGYCGKPIPTEAVPPVAPPVPPPSPMGAPVPPPYPAPGAAAGGVRYGGFWLRFVAYLIDYTIFLIGMVVLFFIIGFAVGISGKAQNVSAAEMESFFTGLAYLVAIPAFWLYFAISESSRWQATLGKRAMGLRVTDGQGQPISFGRATGRHFAKLISAVILGVGFIMAGLTEKKQALHDMMADCLVVKLEGRR